MKCPVCKDTSLVMADRKGVEIDYCPDCRGVWLDRGELDKIIERSAEYGAPVPTPQAAHRSEAVRTEHQVGNDHRKAGNQYDKKGRKKNRMTDLLGDIFDF